jgi:hypothetical protein
MSSNTRSYCVNAPSVISEHIDGETIIMNLQTGHYFSCDRSGATIWSWIVDGMRHDDILSLATATYDAPPETVQPAIEAFLDRLHQENLIREVLAGPVGVRQPTSTPPAGSPFHTPVLNSYTDMEDLLVLDPIHDVAETGWPQQKDAGA